MEKKPENTGQKAAEAFVVDASKWTNQSKQLKEKFTQLTDEDLKFEVGKEAELVGRIATRLNKKTEDVQGIIQRGLTDKA